MRMLLNKGIRILLTSCLLVILLLGSFSLPSPVLAASTPQSAEYSGYYSQPRNLRHHSGKDLGASAQNRIDNTAGKFKQEVKNTKEYVKENADAAKRDVGSKISRAKNQLEVADDSTGNGATYRAERTAKQTADSKGFYSRPRTS